MNEASTHERRMVASFSASIVKSEQSGDLIVFRISNYIVSYRLSTYIYEWIRLTVISVAIYL